MKFLSMLKRPTTCALAVLLVVSLFPTFALAEDATTTVVAKNTDVAVDGNVSVASDKYGVFVLAEENQSASVAVSGDVSVSTDLTSGEVVKKSAVLVRGNGGNTSAEIAGAVDVVATDTAQGVNAAGMDKNSEVSVTIGESVTATAADTKGTTAVDAYGIECDANADTTVTVAVDGAVTATGKGAESQACGAYVYAREGGASSVVVRDNVTATAQTIAVGTKLSTDDGAAAVEVQGDVTGAAKDGIGAWFETSKDAAGTLDLLATGTVHGSTKGMLFEGAGNVTYDITVWQVTTDEGGQLFAASDGASASVGNQVKYIVKVEQPAEGGSARALSSLKEALAQSHGYDVALAGDKVYVNVALQDGYYLAGAYNGAGERTALLHDEGGYYVIVPEGGGVYLSVELAKKDVPSESGGSGSDSIGDAVVPMQAVTWQDARPAAKLPATGDATSVAAVVSVGVAGVVLLAAGRAVRRRG